MEAAIRPVLQSLVEHCLNSGVQVSNALAAIVLRSTILQNTNGMQLEAALKKSNLQVVVKVCVERLIAKNSPSLETIKQQMAFESKLISEHERLEEQAHQHAQTTKNMLSEIGTLNAKGYAALEVLYRKAVAYMIYTSQLGEVTDPVAVKETTQVLETVFPRDELQAFLACPRQEREFQMDELSVIVAGIRLLNKAKDKGGDPIEDAPKKALEESEDLEKKLTEEIENQMKTIESYKVVLNKLYQSQEASKRISRLQDEANNHHQFLAHTTILLEDVTELKERITELKDLHQESVNGLSQAASASPSADTKPLPPEKIYPMFMTLAKIWQQIEKERTQLQARANLFQCLEGMKGNFIPTLNEHDINEASSFSHIPESVSVAKYIELEASKNATGATVIDAKNISNISALEFKGFCPWTTVRRDGMLTKGDSTNAIVRYQGKYYAFASDQAISEFMTNPNEYVEGVVALAKSKPELIFLLDLQSMFPAMQSISSGIMKKGKARIKTSASTELLKRDSGTQTDTHPIPSYIDRNYCWNEWELRRNAIKLVELRYKATHSTQTKNSHFRRDSATQHYAPKENDTQTGISTGTSPTINKNYITGLRGKPTQKVKVVKLHLDL
eukprot:Phypoly_transcript_03148.p1 GENE.Phypoly_transcript_03148~~Phypoly_transcript_03148.p1  ORF type:complete len:618 (+),score=99.88 Phypoly_transcript_03148:604-2457(+)